MKDLNIFQVQEKMDFDIGNIFYIVITLVAVIVGLLGKKKKPAGGGSGTPGSQARPGFLENLERVLQMGQEETAIKHLQDFGEDIPFEEEVPPEVATELLDAPNIIDEYERIMNRSTDGAFDLVSGEGERMTESMEVFDLDYESGTDYFEIVEEFDAGTAIVYSTIINRLEY